MKSKEQNYIIPFDTNDKDLLNNVGHKTLNIINMKKFGLPVPNGYGISYKIYEIFRETNKIPAEIIDKIIMIKKELGGKIAIRSSANIEDGADLSMAGVFETVFIAQDSDIEKSLIHIYSEANSDKVKKYLKLHNIRSDCFKLSIIIQKLITSDITGVLYTGVNNNQNLVQYFAGYDENMLDQPKCGVTLLVNNTGIIKKSCGYDYLRFPYKAIRQLIQYSHLIINKLGNNKLDIEFAFCDNKLYLLQVRPLTTDLNNINVRETVDNYIQRIKEQIIRLAEIEKKELGTQTAVFSDSNYSELLPHPTEMDIGIYTYAFTGLDGIPGATQKGRNELGYKNGKESIGIINYIAGRTFFSIARNAALYYIGVPIIKENYFKIIVNSYLNEINKNPNKGKYPQMGLYMQNPDEDELSKYFDANISEYLKKYQLFSLSMDEKAKKYLPYFNNEQKMGIVEFIDIKKKLIGEWSSLDECLNWCNEILEHLRNTTCVCFVKTARFGFYYSQLLIEFLQKEKKYSHTKSQKLYSKLTQGLSNSAITDINIEISKASTYDKAIKIAKCKIGHFSAGEMLEIHHSTIGENDNLLKAYVDGIRGENYFYSYEKQKNERIFTEHEIIKELNSEQLLYFTKILNFTQKYMALRETIKYIISQEYGLLRRGLDNVERKSGLKKGDIYFLYPRELKALIKNKKEMLHIVEERKERYQYFDNIQIKNIILMDDLEAIKERADGSNNFTKCRGTFLSNGIKLIGTIVNCDEINDWATLSNKINDYKKQNEKVILVAKQMNLSHDPYIALSDGLILENAGIVAHGAQRARELGKGAIGGIKTDILKTGQRIIFDPSKMYIEKINN